MNSGAPCLRLESPSSYKSSQQGVRHSCLTQGQRRDVKDNPMSFENCRSTRTQENSGLALPRYRPKKSVSHGRLMGPNKDPLRQNKMDPPIVPAIRYSGRRCAAEGFVRGLGDRTTSLHQGQGQAQFSNPNALLKTSPNYTDPNDVPQHLRTNWSTRSRGTSMVCRFICKK